eukprot:771077_1
MPSRRRRKKKLETDSESPANKRLRLDVTNQRATQPNVNNPQNNANNIDESTVAPIETELESNVNDPSIAQSNVDVSTVDPQNNVDVSTVDPQNNVDVSTVDPQNNVDVSTVDPMETDEKTSFSRDWFEQNPGSDCFPNIIMEEAKMNEDIKHLCANIERDIDYLRSQSYYVKGLDKLFTTTPGSFSAWCTELEHAYGRKCGIFDECGSFVKLFNINPSGNSVESSIFLNLFHRANIDRGFIDTDYNSTCKKPFVNTQILSQPELFEQAFASAVSTGLIARFVLASARYAKPRINRIYFGTCDLKVRHFMTQDVILQGLFQGITRCGFFQTLMDPNCNNVEVYFDIKCDALMGSLELLLQECARKQGIHFKQSKNTHTQNARGTKDPKRYLQGFVSKATELLDRLAANIAICEHFTTYLVENGQFKTRALAYDANHSKPLQITISNPDIVMGAFELILDSIDTFASVFISDSFVLQDFTWNFDVNDLLICQRVINKTDNDKQEMDEEEVEEIKDNKVHPIINEITQFILIPGSVFNLSGFGATQFKVQNASIANALKLSPSESSSLTTLKKLINISSVLERFRLGKIVQNSNLNGGKCMFIKRPINLNSLEPEVVVGLGTLGIPPSSYVQSYNKPNIVIWKKRDWIKKFPEDFASKVTEMTADYDNLEYRGTDIVSYLNAWDEQLPFKTIDEAKLIIDGLEAFMKEQKLIERKIRPNYNVDLNAKSLRNHYTDLRKIHLEHIINIHNLMRDDEIDQMTKRFNGLNASDIKPIDWFGSNKREKKCENKLLKCDKIPAHWKHDYKDSNK